MHCVVVIIGALSHFRLVCQKFKKHNAKWTEIKVIITDKDMVERIVFTDEISNAALHICLYHVLRTFRREVTTEKRVIS